MSEKAALATAEKRIAELEHALLRTNKTRHGVNEDAHNEDKALRAKAREAKQSVLDECLDPVKAAEHDVRKPRYYYTVSATWSVPNIDKRTGAQVGVKQKTEARKVVAQDENEAWATFCDATSDWPSRRTAKPKIERGDKVPMETVMAMAMTPPYRDPLHVSS